MSYRYPHADDNGAVSPVDTVNYHSEIPLLAPYQIACSNEEAPGVPMTPQATLALFSFSTHPEPATFHEKNLEKRAGYQPDYHPMSTYNRDYRSQGYEQDRLQFFQLRNSLPNGRSCPRRCPCVCHATSQSASSHLHVFDEEEPRPSVIMAPVGCNNRTTSTVTHVPLPVKVNSHLLKPLNSWFYMEQGTPNWMSEDDSDSDESSKEENYFRVSLDGAKARFKLTKEDWQRIPINTFPSGGRLLSGDWTRIFDRKRKASNPWCSLRFKNNHVRSKNSRKMHSAPFFRGVGECKRPECNIKVRFIIKEEKGRYVDVMYTGNVCHKTVRKEEMASQRIEA